MLSVSQRSQSHQHHPWTLLFSVWCFALVISPAFVPTSNAMLLKPRGKMGSGCGSASQHASIASVLFLDSRECRWEHGRIWRSHQYEDRLIGHSPIDLPPNQSSRCMESQADQEVSSGSKHATSKENPENNTNKTEHLSIFFSPTERQKLVC